MEPHAAVDTLIKFIIKLAIVVALANAAWRAGSVYLAFYKFQDDVIGTVQYRGIKTDEQIRKRILDEAKAADIPIADDDSLVVRREGNHTIVDGSYVQSAELFPGYPHTFPFTIHLNVPTSTLP